MLGETASARAAAPQLPHLRGHEAVMREQELCQQRLLIDARRSEIIFRDREGRKEGRRERKHWRQDKRIVEPVWPSLQEHKLKAAIHAAATVTASLVLCA